MKNKIWTKEELAEWKEKQKVVNAEYRTAVDHQLEEWVKGNNIHNNVNSINSIVDEDDNVVGYYQFEGGECCPDFSCCNSNSWDIELRRKFTELYHNGDTAACQEMLMNGLNSLFNSKENKKFKKVYVAGQIAETKH